MSEKPWYQNGLRFQCTLCGDCCTGDSGYVWVTNEEIAALAAEIGETNVEEFEQKYVRQVGVRKSLKEYPNGDCVFFDSDKRQCTVYHCRPCQCRTWPFWSSNLRTPQEWEKTCAICPGSGKGRLYQLPEIEAQRSVIRV